MESSGVDHRVREAAAFLPASVQQRLAGWFGSSDPAVRDRARAAAWGFALLGRAGCRVTDVLGDDLFRCEDARGGPHAFAAHSFTTPAYEGGDRAAVENLVQALEGAFGDWRFALHLRRPLEPGFDPSSVARAVHLWRLAMDRGDWRGRHAVYDDESVSLDLTVTTRRKSGAAGGPMVRVPPMPGPERLARVVQRLEATTLALDDIDRDLPLVVLLYAEPAWRLPRGTVKEVLYGAADRTVATSGPEGTSFRAWYRPSGTSLFSDVAYRSISALWWLEGAPGAPFVDGWAHENPWCEHAGRVPVFPGVRFAPDEALDGQRLPLQRPIAMAWTARGATRFGIDR